MTVPAAILLLALYIMIFSFSEQDGAQSESISRYISERCVDLFNRLANKNWGTAMQASLAEYFEHPLRKFAHFAEYSCMGVLVYFILRQWKNRGRVLYTIVVCWVFLSAALDEFHQYFVPDRYASLADVLLDTCGGIFGMLLMMFMCDKIRIRKQ